MRGVWPSEQDAERAFAEEAAKSFAENPESTTYTEGNLDAGALLALRWGLLDDCVVVIKISDDHEPVNYYNLVAKYQAKARGES